MKPVKVVAQVAYVLSRQDMAKVARAVSSPHGDERNPCLKLRQGPLLERAAQDWESGVDSLYSDQVGHPRDSWRRIFLAHGAGSRSTRQGLSNGFTDFSLKGIRKSGSLRYLGYAASFDGAVSIDSPATAAGAETT